MINLSVFLNVVGAVIGSAAACLYGVRIWMGKEQANLATWFIIFILDFVGLYLAYATGNTEPYIQIGWCVAATIILLATFVRKGQWVWSKTETGVLLICLTSVAIWLSSKAMTVSLLGYVTADVISAIPQAKDYVKNPEAARKSAWVWQVSIVAILFSIAAKLVNGEFGAEHTLVYVALLGLNAAMTYLCLRAPNKQGEGK
ncbi:MAG: hypothetical protein RIQ41_105 [Candidatus Parcubacteria bacterium]|jgi:hypothetical protein